MTTFYPYALHSRPLPLLAAVAGWPHFNSIRRSVGRFVGRSEEEEEEEVTAGAFRVVLLMCTQRIKYNEMIHKDTFASWLLCIFDGNAIS